MRLRGGGCFLSKEESEWKAYLAQVELQQPSAKAKALDAAQAAARLAANDRHPDGYSAWARFGGAELETALQHDAELGGPPVRLVDARFLIQLHALGGTLLRRQDLPDDAFVSLTDLKRWGPGNSAEVGHECLRIVVLSHPWLQPDRCDPKDTTLSLLVQVLTLLVESESNGRGSYACFVDFCSLTQKGPLGEERTPHEALLFKRALQTMTEWYCHPKTIVVKMTTLPANYPEGFCFPPGMHANKAGYWERGWCHCESSVSNLVKDRSLVLDMAMYSPPELSCEGFSYGRRYALWEELVDACAAKRTPPLLPADFSRMLADKSFTSKKADMDVVSALFEGAFDARLRTATALNLSVLGWADDDAELLASTLADGQLTQLRHLKLGGNQIGDRGATAIAAALTRRQLISLQTVTLSGNQIGQDGLKALAEAVASGGIPCLDLGHSVVPLDVNSNPAFDKNANPEGPFRHMPKLLEQAIERFRASRVKVGQRVTVTRHGDSRLGEEGVAMEVEAAGAMIRFDDDAVVGLKHTSFEVLIQ